MKQNRKLLFLTLACSIILFSACGTPTPEPTATPEPTEEPQPTATEARVESAYFSYTDGEWSRLFEDELSFPFFLPEEMDEASSQNYQMIQTGYFAAYDPAAQVLTMRSLVIMAKIYREVQFQLDENLIVSCLPADIDGTPIEEISYLYSENGVGFPPGPRKQKLGDVISDFSTDTYMVLILDAPVDPQAVNLVKQVAAVCPE